MVGKPEDWEFSSFPDYAEIRDGKLMAKNTPEALYNTLNSEYIGSFFNEVNEIPNNIINHQSRSKKAILVYPNQIKMVEDSLLKAIVITSYFKGYHYLIEADLKQAATIVASFVYHSAQRADLLPRKPLPTPAPARQN